MTLPAQLPDATEPETEPQPQREVSFAATFAAVVGVSALVVILCVLGAAMSGLFNFVSDGATTTEAAPATPPERAPATTFSDGQYLVGKDIQPGTYGLTVAAGSPGCSWERNSATDGSPTSVLEAGGGKEGDALVVNVRATDVVFQSRDCGTWQRTGD